MSLQERLEGDMKAAMKAGDEVRTSVLRMIRASVHNREIEARAKGTETLTEEQVSAVVHGEAKKRREARELYLKGNRSDLADKEARELAIIEAYLPKRMSREETEQAVARIIAEAHPADFPAAMRAVLAELKGKADAAVVAEFVRKHFS